MLEYRAAGADVVMAKHQGPEVLHRWIKLSQSSIMESTIMEEAMVAMGMASDGLDQVCTDAYPVELVAAFRMGISDALLDRFRETSCSSLAALRAAIKQGEPCDRLLHSLAGSSACVGATRLAYRLAKWKAQSPPFGESEMEELEALHAETLRAFDEGTPPGGGMGSRSLLVSLPTAAPPGCAKPQDSSSPELHGDTVAPSAARPSARPVPPWHAHAPVCVAVDDAAIPRMMQTILLESLGADMGLSRVLGETDEVHFCGTILTPHPLTYSIATITSRAPKRRKCSTSSTSAWGLSMRSSNRCRRRTDKSISRSSTKR